MIMEGLKKKENDEIRDYSNINDSDFYGDRDKH